MKGVKEYEKEQAKRERERERLSILTLSESIDLPDFYSL